MPIGQQIDETAKKYYRHPTAGIIANGDPLDAGTAHFMHSNMSFLSQENRRLLGHVIGPGAVGWDTSTNAQWYGVISNGGDQNPSIPSTTSTNYPYNNIPLISGINCVNIGPFHATDANSVFSELEYQVVIECTKGNVFGTDLALAVFINETSSPAERTTINYTGSGTYQVHFQFYTGQANITQSAWRGRSSSSEQSTIVYPLLFKVAWLSNDVTQNDYIHSISVFEVTP